MTADFNLDGHGGPDLDIPIEDLQSFVKDFPALLWRIEIARSRIEFLNAPTLPTLRENARQLLKNSEYRQKALLREDAHLFDAFLEAVKESRTMATVFRFRDESGQVQWLKITGAVNSSDPRFYYGYLIDVNDTVQTIRGIIDSHVESETMVEQAQGAVLLVDYASRRVHKANAQARALFGLPADRRKRLELSGLYPRRMAKAVARLLDELPFTRVWDGKLEMTDARGADLTADVSARFLAWQGRGLVRMRVEPEARTSRGGNGNGRRKAMSGAARKLAERLKGMTDIDAILGEAMAAPGMENCCEAILFSDVLARKNRVEVYGAGEPFRRMALGEVYSYKGTIAEDIVRYELDHIVVDETVDSIKPIDWALFIPRGVRSYYAKPYYERGVLRTVMILCSTEPGRFDKKGPSDFDFLLDPLAQAVRSWRRAEKAGKRR